MRLGRLVVVSVALGAFGCSEASPSGPSPAMAATSGSAGMGGVTVLAGAAGSAVAGGGAGDASSGAASVAGQGGGGANAGAAGGGAGGTGMVVSGDGPPSSRQSARPLGSTASVQGFYEYLPPGYGDGTLRPLLLFFHGGGERGDGVGELSKLLVHGPPWLISKDEWPAERPFVVLSPQHPSAIGGCPDADEVDAFLKFALSSYAVDPKRVYLTGLSCGGLAIWRYLGKYGGKSLAGSVPICGDGRESWTMGGCKLAEAAVWAFHGGADVDVVPAGTTETVTHLLECPAPPRAEVKMNIFPGVPHVSWPPVYDGTAGFDVYGWMLEHTAP